MASSRTTKAPLIGQRSAETVAATTSNTNDARLAHGRRTPWVSDTGLVSFLTRRLRSECRHVDAARVLRAIRATRWKEPLSGAQPRPTSSQADNARRADLLGARAAGKLGPRVVDFTAVLPREDAASPVRAFGIVLADMRRNTCATAVRCRGTIVVGLAGLCNAAVRPTAARAAPIDFAIRVGEAFAEVGVGVARIHEATTAPTTVRIRAALGGIRNVIVAAGPSLAHVEFRRAASQQSADDQRDRPEGLFWTPFPQADGPKQVAFLLGNAARRFMCESKPVCG